MLHFERRKGKKRRAQGTLLDEHGLTMTNFVMSFTVKMKYVL